MSFLPYGDGGSLSWLGAFGTSAALHGGTVAALFALGSTQLSIAAEAPEARPEFRITMEELDADTLAGLIEQAGLAGAEGQQEEAAESTAPDPADPQDAEAPSAPDLPDDTAQDPEPAASTEPEPEPEPANPLDETALPVEVPEPAAVDAVVAAGSTLPDAPLLETLAPAPLVDTVSPILGDGVLAPSDPGPLVPDAPVIDVVTAESPAGLGVAADVTTGIAVAAITPETVTTGPAPPSTAAPPPAPPSEQDLAVRDLIDRLREQVPPSCLIALPRRDGDTGVGLAVLADQDSAMEVYASAVLTPEDTDLRQTRTLVDPRQCPALDFVAGTAAYPGVQVGISVDQTTVPSGGTVSGALRGIGGRFLTLVLVDDNGVVTDLQRFTASAGNVARFDVPVTRVGLARETRPLILAILTDRPPAAFRARLGLRAEDVFQDALVEGLGDVRIGLVAVDIR